MSPIQAARANPGSEGCSKSEELRSAPEISENIGSHRERIKYYVPETLTLKPMSPDSCREHSAGACKRQGLTPKIDPKDIMTPKISTRGLPSPYEIQWQTPKLCLPTRGLVWRIGIQI